MTGVQTCALPIYRLNLLEPERLAIIRKLLPVYGESAVPLDMFEDTVPALWRHRIERPWGAWDLLSVVNFGESSLVKEIPLERLKLHRDQPVIVWDFWTGSEHGNLADGVLRVALKPHSVKTLRLTAIDKGRTALVGSTFHMAMGAVEIIETRSSGKGVLTIRASRPGPEEGSLAFWSAEKQRVITETVKLGPSAASLTIA